MLHGNCMQNLELRIFLHFQEGNLTPMDSMATTWAPQNSKVNKFEAKLFKYTLDNIWRCGV